MGFFLTLGVWAALWLISYGLRKLNEPDAPAIPGIEKLPRVTESDPVPMSFGRNRIEASNVIWFGGERVITRSNPNDTTDNIYFACGLFALSLSNIDISDSSDELQARLTLVLANDEPPVQGSWNETPISPGVTWYDVHIRHTEGDSIAGIAELNAGRWDMDIGLDTTPLLARAYSLGYTDATWVDSQLIGIDLSMIPPYQGIITCCLGDYQAWLPDTDREPRINPRFYFGRSPSIPAIAFELVNPVGIPGVDQDLMEFNDGAANPMGVLYVMLTRAWGGLGLDPATIDIDSLAEAAEVLKEERNSISAVVYRAETAESLVSRLCDQVEGVLYHDPDSLLLTFKLTREDYDVDDLEELDLDSLTGEPEFSMMTYDQTRNKVFVKFRNRYKGYKDDEVFAFDQANYEMTGEVRAETIDMPWVTDPYNAAFIASRALRAWALPLAKVKFGVKRSTVFWTPGKVFKYTHPSNGKTFVMRVQRADVGASNSGEVVVDAVQDRWAVGQVFVDPPDISVEVQAAPPPPPVTQDAPETPRWLLVRHQMQVGGPDPDSPRIMYLATPGGDSDYEASLGLDPDEFPDGREIDVVRFSGTARLSGSYNREAEPFDTTGGIAIEDIQNWTPEDATEDEIREHGYNLVQIGEGRDAEIIAFMTWNGATATTGTMEDVHRGLFDTTPRAHATGTPVYLLELRPEAWARQILRRIGIRGLARGNVVTTAIVPVASGGRPPRNEIELDGTTIVSRPLLPYPVADLVVENGSGDKYLGFDGEVEEEGVDFSWKRRDRLVDTITLGTDADEMSPEENVTYSLIVQKEGDSEIVVESGLTGTELFDAAAAPAGHGSLRIAIRTVRVIDNGIEITYESWQDAFFDGTFYPWRNLLLNPGFLVDGSMSFSRWTQLAGTAVIGNNGVTMPELFHHYVTGTTGDGTTEWRQRVDIHGYRPKNMRALVLYKIRGISDSDDTIEADLQSLDAASANLQTDTDGPVAPASTSYWETRELDISHLDEDTHSLQVRFEQVGAGEIDGHPQGAVADPIMMVGQFTNEQLANPSLIGTTSWTVASGSFITRSTTGSEGMQYVQASAAGSVLTQTVSVPAGYLFSEAVFRVSTRADSGTNANAEIQIDALDGGGTPIATMMREGLVFDFGWYRTLVHVPVPDGTANVRVTLTAVDSATQFDDASLRFHKWLDPQHELTFDFSEPFEQEVPRSPYLWMRHHPDLPVPSYGLFPGTPTGVLGTEPIMRIPATVRRAGVYLPSFHDALEFRETSDAVVKARSDTLFANFAAARSFSVRVVFAPNTALTDYGLCGRLGATGWELDVSGGQARARLVGASATKTVLDGSGIARGGATFAALIYDAGANTLRCVTPFGNASVSTVGMGEITCDGLPFCIGDASASSPVSMTGTIISVELWSEALDAADLQAAWKWGKDHWSHGYSMPDSPANFSSMSCVVGSDEDGEVLGEFAYGSKGLWAIAGGETVMPISPSRASLVDPNPNTTTDWDVTDNVMTVTLNAARGPNGRWEAVRLSSDETAARQIAVTLDDTKKVHVSFMARRVSVPGDGRIRILEAGGDPCSDFIPFTMTTLWKRFDLYDIDIDPGFTPARVAWYTCDAGGAPIEMDLAGPIWIDQDTVHSAPPIALPTVTSGDAGTWATVEGLDLAVQHKYEGEIEIQAIALSPDLEAGTFAHLVTAGDDDLLVYSTAGETHFDHLDGAGASVTMDVTENSDWDERRTVRARWNYLALLDTTPDHVGLVTDAGEDFGRSGSWTPDADPYDMLEIGHHDSGGDGFNGGIVRLTVRAREKILPAVL